MDEEVKMADPKWRLFETHEVTHTPYLTIIPRARVGYEMVDSQPGA